MNDLAQRVKNIVAVHFGVTPDKLTEQTRFIQDLGADSLDIVELVMDFEEEFDCEISDDAIGTIKTIDDALKLFEKCAKLSAFSADR